jgi:hypothetical protein
MARPHILFVQAQDLPWRSGLYSGARTEVSSKILSIDEAGTDATTIVRYPAGWSRPHPEHLTVHEEFLVLDGALEINGRVYTAQNYGFFPAGFVRTSAAAPNGATVLTMFYDAPQVVEGVPATPHDPALLVEHVDPLTMEWDPGLVDPQLSAGVAIKPLSNRSLHAGNVVSLYVPPHRVPPGMAKPQWTHSMVEELFCLAALTSGAIVAEWVRAVTPGGAKVYTMGLPEPTSDICCSCDDQRPARQHLRNREETVSVGTRPTGHSCRRS